MAFWNFYLWIAFIGPLVPLVPLDILEPGDGDFAVDFRYFDGITQ